MSASRTSIPAPDDEERQAQLRANQGLIALLDSWSEPSDEERQEQRETWEFLQRAVDSDRPAGLKLYE